MRPFRPAGPTQWVVGAPSPPPPGLHSINNAPILIQVITPKRSGPPVVCAGKAPPAADSSHPKGVDPLAIDDPWSQYKLAKGEAVGTNPVPRQTDAPTTRKFQQADSRLDSLEAAVRDLKKDKEQAQADLAGMKKEVQAEVKSIRGDMAGLSQELQRQLQANVDALQQAQRVQQSQMSTGFAEIKALLQSSAQASKRPVEDNSGGMSDL